jgi:hypothetical protein
LLAVESGGVGDAVDGFDGCVDLRLVRLNFRLAQCRIVHARQRERFNLGEQRRDLRQSPFRGGDHRVRALVIFKRSVDRGDLRFEIFHCDEAGGVVGGPVDSRAGGELGEEVALAGGCLVDDAEQLHCVDVCDCHSHGLGPFQKEVQNPSRWTVASSDIIRGWAKTLISIFPIEESRARDGRFSGVGPARSRSAFHAGARRSGATSAMPNGIGPGQG